MFNPVCNIVKASVLKATKCIYIVIVNSYIIDEYLNNATATFVKFYSFVKNYSVKHLCYCVFQVLKLTYVPTRKMHLILL